MTIEQEKNRRGFRRWPYQDPQGVWRVGYGEPATSITQEVTELEAEKWLITEVSRLKEERK
jgi:GH24 family phage-related lysozyme (muramidase)